MLIQPFGIARLPRIEFGEGTIGNLPKHIALFGRRVLLVTGGRSIEDARQWPSLLQGLRENGIDWERFKVTQEPSPELIDEAVSQMHAAGFEAVVGIGGGSVLDAAKAIAGLLPSGRSVMDYLEGVGPELPYEGPALPFIAVPTTAGTGSEATKNAVLSRTGKDGFKKSFRDERLVPELALVDPDLLASCPPELVAANGMDALTQLMESFVSLKANPFTDALAISGIAAVRTSLLEWYEGGAEANPARTGMAYAALLSGITLAQTGLGSVHGLASPLGAFFPIPHGVVCGTLVAAATEINILALNSREPANPALDKYARMSEILTGSIHESREGAWHSLTETLQAWTDRLRLPRLARYGVTHDDLPLVVANSRGSSMKTNPIVLSDAEVLQILERRL